MASPGATFEHTSRAADGAFATATYETRTHGPSGLTGAYSWVDVDGEGLPELLCRDGQGWYFKRNLGTDRFAPARAAHDVPRALDADGVLSDSTATGAWTS